MYCSLILIVFWVKNRMFNVSCALLKKYFPQNVAVCWSHITQSTAFYNCLTIDKYKRSVYAFSESVLELFLIILIRFSSIERSILLTFQTEVKRRDTFYDEIFSGNAVGGSVYLR